MTNREPTDHDLIVISDLYLQLGHHEDDSVESLMALLAEVWDYNPDDPHQLAQYTKRMSTTAMFLAHWWRDGIPEYKIRWAPSDPPRYTPTTTDEDN